MRDPSRLKGSEIRKTARLEVLAHLLALYQEPVIFWFSVNELSLYVHAVFPVRCENTAFCGYTIDSF